MPSSDSSRRYARVDVRAQARVSSIDAERDAASGALCFRESDELCATLSVGGAFIHTDDPPAPGRRVLLQIALPGGASVEAVGRVAWTQRPVGTRGEAGPAAGAGIEFVSDDQETRGVIARYLEALRRQRTPR
jgi:Tfp pilus assembly protein PilZ